MGYARHPGCIPVHNGQMFRRWPAMTWGNPRLPAHKQRKMALHLACRTEPACIAERPVPSRTLEYPPYGREIHAMSIFRRMSEWAFWSVGWVRIHERVNIATSLGSSMWWVTTETQVCCCDTNNKLWRVWLLRGHVWMGMGGKWGLRLLLLLLLLVSCCVVVICHYLGSGSVQPHRCCFRVCTQPMSRIGWQSCM